MTQEDLNQLAHVHAIKVSGGIWQGANSRNAANDYREGFKKALKLVLSSFKLSPSCITDGNLKTIKWMQELSK